jgi:hypothetical protein
MDEPSSAGAEGAFHDLPVVDADRGRIIAVFRVKMRRRRVVVLRGDDDAEEPAQLGQSNLLRPFMPQILALCFKTPYAK